MNVGIDVRAFLTPHRTGVAEYAHELLSAVFALDKTNQYWLFFNAYKDFGQYLPRWEQENVRYVETKWPNKALNASLRLFGKPELDELVAKNYELRIKNQELKQFNNVTLEQWNNLDYFFSPNLNFTALSPGTKHILTIHDLSFELFPECYSWKRRRWHQMVQPRQQCEKVHVVLTPSENTKRDVIELYGIDAQKVRVIRPGIVQKEQGTRNKEQIRKKYNLPERFILFLGTIEPRKNIIGVIEAYKRYSESKKYPASLVIAGTRGWKEGGILRMIKKTPGVQYVGFVDAEDKRMLYAMAKVFVYPSLYEGFGFPVLEAFAAGTPVITSNRSSLPEVAHDAAYLVNPYNVGEIERAMTLLFSDEALREFFVKRGREWVKEFSWEKAARDFLRVLK